MNRQFLRRNLPSEKKINEHWAIQRLGLKLNFPGIFVLSKRTVPPAAAAGIFIAFMPIPFQFILVTIVTLLFRINLPLGIAMIFVTNPLTMGPLYYLCYQLGLWITQPALIADSGNALNQLTIVTYPLWIGCLTTGAILATIAYLASQLMWRSAILSQKGNLARRVSQRYKKGIST